MLHIIRDSLSICILNWWIFRQGMCKRNYLQIGLSHPGNVCICFWFHIYHRLSSYCHTMHILCRLISRRVSIDICLHLQPSQNDQFHHINDKFLVLYSFYIRLSRHHKFLMYRWSKILKHISITLILAAFGNVHQHHIMCRCHLPDRYCIQLDTQHINLKFRYNGPCSCIYWFHSLSNAQSSCIRCM